LAGAFVHLQKERLRPAEALFQLADRNLHKYPALHHATDVAGILGLISQWRAALAEREFGANHLGELPAPVIPLPE
ncbi:MAG: hypothetical protein MUF81_14760, partial [Verrucomicrobia bacterium]|nr:hypothetical protein [Verrucomicrobiota bacterium]